LTGKVPKLNKGLKSEFSKVLLRKEKAREIEEMIAKVRSSKNNTVWLPITFLGRIEDKGLQVRSG
jgi:hypothetical protein